MQKVHHHNFFFLVHKNITKIEHASTHFLLTLLTLIGTLDTDGSNTTETWELESIKQNQ